VNEKPSDLLVKALDGIPHRGLALDLGAGALSNSRFLRKKGFDVVAVDPNPLSNAIARKINDPRLRHIRTSFEEFEFPVRTYHLVVAMKSMVYCRNAAWLNLMENIKHSLLPGGYFVADFTGSRSRARKIYDNDSHTFPTRKQLESALGGMDILSLGERRCGTDKGPCNCLSLISRKPTTERRFYFKPGYTEPEEIRMPYVD